MFTVPGRLCPNNVYTRKFRNVSTRNSRASDDLAVIRELAGAAADNAYWRTVGEKGAVFINLVLWNQMGDIDARPKIVLDGLQKIVYDDDKRVKKLHLEMKYDHYGPRVDISVEEMPIPQRAAKIRPIRFEDLGWPELMIVAKNGSDELDPQPGVFFPIRCDALPKSWHNRALKALQEYGACRNT